MTAAIIGIALALAVGGFARWIGLDRDRTFYSTVMMVIAFLYVLFAAAGDPAALPVEALVGTGFFALATLGFKQSAWLVVAALVGHGLFDLVHPHVVENRGVPVWWPCFCSAYDITAGALLGFMNLRAKERPDAAPSPQPNAP
ncbi:MAG: hypothetical protein ABUL68_03475 [Pseudomonadota bacterium]